MCVVIPSYSRVPFMLQKPAHWINEVRTEMVSPLFEPIWPTLLRENSLMAQKGLLKTFDFLIYQRFPCWIHWNKFQGLIPGISQYMIIWSWCRYNGGMGKERIENENSYEVILWQIWTWSWRVVLNPPTFMDIGTQNSHPLLIFCFQPHLVRKLAIIH